MKNNRTGRMLARREMERLIHLELEREVRETARKPNVRESMLRLLTGAGQSYV